jgi:hypothetical protein
MRWAIIAIRYGMIATIASVSLSGAPVLAQGPNGVSSIAVERQRQGQLDTLTKVVKLTPDQVTQVKAINDDTIKRLLDLRNSGKNPSAARPTIIAIRSYQQTRIRALLTNDQKPPVRCLRRILASRPASQRQAT